MESVILTLLFLGKPHAVVDFKYLVHIFFAIILNMWKRKNGRKTIDHFSLNHRRLFSLRPEPLSRSLEFSTLVVKPKRFYRSVYFRYTIVFKQSF